MAKFNSSFSTQGGEIGFSVKLEDGRIFVEDQHTWDDIPSTHRVQELKIIHLKTGHAFINLTNYEWYFFENEAVNSVGSGLLMHSAKIFGGANPGNGAVEIRLEFSSKSIVPTYSKIDYSWDDWQSRIKRRTSVLRPGISGIKPIPF